MNKYPLDSKGVQNIIADIVQNDIAQREVNLKLCLLLRTAMSYIENSDMEWYTDAQELLKDLQDRKVAFENLRFDQGNGHKINEVSPFVGITGLNESPSHEGGEMTEEELAVHFGEPLPKAKQEKPINKMTLEEIEAWEKQQDNSNDIYKIKARIKNLVRAESGGSITDVGEMLVNCYVHVMKALYDFADKVEDKETKIKLIGLIQSQENMPGQFISAVHANVKEKK